MPVAKLLFENTGSRKGIFPEERFTYDIKTDTYTCPAGKVLKRRTLHVNHRNIGYSASRQDCSSCPMRPECTRSKGPRTVQRSARKDEFDRMIKEATSPSSRRDLKTRKHLMERSFARSTLFGFDRARFRGLWKVAVQEYLICAIQNIRTLITHGRKKTRGIVTLSPDKTSTQGINQIILFSGKSTITIFLAILHNGVSPDVGSSISCILFPYEVNRLTTLVGEQ